MASISYTIPLATWVEIPYTDGSILHKSGGKVVYLEAAAEPTANYDDLPIMKSTDSSEAFAFNRVPDGESIWAYAPNAGAIISVTPAG